MWGVIKIARNYESFLPEGLEKLQIAESEKISRNKGILKQFTFSIQKRDVRVYRTVSQDMLQNIIFLHFFVNLHVVKLECACCLDQFKIGTNASYWEKQPGSELLGERREGMVEAVEVAKLCLWRYEKESQLNR